LKSNDERVVALQQQLLSGASGLHSLACNS